MAAFSISGATSTRKSSQSSGAMRRTTIKPWVSHTAIMSRENIHWRRQLPQNSGASPEQPHQEVAGEPRHNRDDGRPNHGWNEICDETGPIARRHHEERCTDRE